jgi:hypothetical protein
MTDKELLTLAAKAAGYRIKWAADDGAVIWIDDVPLLWNPLTDDGDALRLAVKLKLRLSTVCNDGNASVASATDMYIDAHVVEHEGNPYAATRRAITRAAAAIGEQMP